MFLDALQGKNQGRPPVWLMRQAGRYMPEYRALREKHSLKTLFCTPELVAEITLMPVDQLGTDAAILFSDITLIALGLGLDLDFREGPIVSPRVTPATSLSFLPEQLDPTLEAIRLLKSQLKVPLIGFCGGPFTTATYFSDAKKWLYSDPISFHRFLEKITDLSIEVLKRQIAAGVNAVQIFDSWAAELSTQEFALFCAPYLRKIIDALSVPVILFMRGGAAFAEELCQLKPAALSCDWQWPLTEWRKRAPHLALQGNLDPDLLYAPPAVIRQKTLQILESMRSDPAFILNLGHGVKPDTPVESVRCFIDTCFECKESINI